MAVPHARFDLVDVVWPQAATGEILLEAMQPMLRILAVADGWCRLVDEVSGVVGGWVVVWWLGGVVAWYDGLVWWGGVGDGVAVSRGGESMPNAHAIADLLGLARG